MLRENWYHLPVISSTASPGALLIFCTITGKSLFFFFSRLCLLWFWRICFRSSVIFHPLISQLFYNGKRENHKAVLICSATLASTKLRSRGGDHHQQPRGWTDGRTGAGASLPESKPNHFSKSQKPQEILPNNSLKAIDAGPAAGCLSQVTHRCLLPP